jgi:hypothetical protein
LKVFQLSTFNESFAHDKKGYFGDSG